VYWIHWLYKLNELSRLSVLNSERREFQSMELNSEKREKYEKYTHVEFIEIYNYLSDETYPEHIGLTDKGLKSNFGKACKNFEVVHNELRVQMQTKGWFYNNGKFLAWLKY